MFRHLDPMRVNDLAVVPLGLFGEELAVLQITLVLFRAVGISLIRFLATESDDEIVLTRTGIRLIDVLEFRTRGPGSRELDQLRLELLIDPRLQYHPGN